MNDVIRRKISKKNPYTVCKGSSIKYTVYVHSLRFHIWLAYFPLRYCAKNLRNATRLLVCIYKTSYINGKCKICLIVSKGTWYDCLNMAKTSRTLNTATFFYTLVRKSIEYCVEHYYVKKHFSPNVFFHEIFENKLTNTLSM